MTDHDRDPLPPGPALGTDGTVTGRPAPQPSVEPVPPAEEAPLELQERPRAVFEPPPDSYREPPQQRSTNPALAVVVVAVALAAGFFGASLLTRRDPGGGPDVVKPTSEVGGLLAPKRLAVVIDSEPAGAVVQIGSDVVGVTPWAGDNRWGEAEVRLTLKGHQPWKGRLSGDADSHLSATLQRQ